MRKRNGLAIEVLFTVLLFANSLACRASSVEDEARNFVISDFAKHWTQCGDSWFTQQQTPSSALFYSQEFDCIEQRGVQVSVSSDTITEAERMNGLEWRGRVNFMGKVYRYHFPPGIKQLPLNSDPPPPGWTQWFDGVASLPTYTIIKIRGRWNTSEPFNRSPLQPIACAEASKLEERVAKQLAQQELRNKEEEERQNEKRRRTISPEAGKITTLNLVAVPNEWSSLVAFPPGHTISINTPGFHDVRFMVNENPNATFLAKEGFTEHINVIQFRSEGETPVHFTITVTPR